MGEFEITRRDLLTPLGDFEKRNNIGLTRNDIPRRFLGRCPSKFYREVDMDTKVLLRNVGDMFKRIYRKQF